MYSQREFVHNHGHRAHVYEEKSLFYELCSTCICLVSVFVGAVWLLTYLSK